MELCTAFGGRSLILDLGGQWFLKTQLMCIVRKKVPHVMMVVLWGRVMSRSLSLITVQLTWVI